jgi:hypothetical protein
MSGKILRATIESCKGVTNKKIDFSDKQILALIGDGATGKTSLVRFFQAVTSGKIDENLINNKTGKMAGTAEIEMDGQLYTVRLSRTKKSETVEVKSSDNMRGGKEVLRRLVGTVAIDPFWLAGLDLDKQIKEFKKMMRVDTSDIDRQIKDEVAEREILGREVRTLDGSIKADPNNRIDFEQHRLKYEKEKPIGDLPERLKEAIRQNRERTEKLTTLQNQDREATSLANTLNAINEQIRRLTEQRDKIEQQLTSNVEDREKLGLWLSENPEQPIEPIQKEIDDINEFNRERASLQSYFEKMDLKKKKDEEYRQQKLKVNELEERRADMVRKASAIIPDFEFLEPRYDDQGKMIDDREGPYYRGVPISSLSHTELVMFAINFKQALDSGLPVIIVDDFESVGSEGRKALEDLCQKGVCQAIVSMMDAKQPELKIVLKNSLDFTKSDDETELKQDDKTPTVAQNKTNGATISEKSTTTTQASDEESRASLADFESQFPDEKDENQ